MTEHSTEHSTEHYTFTIERSYAATAARVFAAWAEPEARSTWRDDPDFKASEPDDDYELDFSIGGHERFSGTTPEGKSYRYDGVTYDIVVNERIVSAYEMYLSDERMSVSVATVEMEQVGDKTTLTYTEQGVMLDGIDTPSGREGGTAWLLDNLGKYLATSPDGAA
jgi:uncharacterized protein YndB with AHSA1/START domain